MSALELTRTLLGKCLQLDNARLLTRETRLLGHIPELNSLTVATLVMEIEETVDCEIEDEEMTADIFDTVGSLADFVDKKMAST